MENLGLMGVIFAWFSAAGFVWSYFYWTAEPQWAGAIAILSLIGFFVSFIMAAVDDRSV